MRNACLDKVHDLAKRDGRVVFIGSDLSPGLLGDMKREMPERYYMEGITEQRIHGQTIQISAGVAVYPEDGRTEDALRKHADDELYQAKRGRQ